MAAQHKWKMDNKITAMMVEDMLFNPLLAAKILLRVKLPPHEELRILWMWTKYFTSDDSGFSTGKSWSFALVAALRSMLIPGRVSGIISKTFTQGKLIFRNFDKWYETCPIFKNCILHAGGKKRLVHGNDVWQAEFLGQGEIRVLPPDFMRDSERIRSERWHDAYFDEWTTYGNFKALNKTFIGRISNINHYDECPVRMNHVHLGSTPTYKHHPSYTVIKPVNKAIRSGNKDYGRFTCNWRHIPKTPEWKFLVSDKTLYHMQTNLPKGTVKSEVDGLWSEDSMSWYSSQYTELARSVTPTMQLARASDDEIFIAGFDTAPGGDTHSARVPDDSSISILKYSKSDPKPKHVLTFRATGISDTDFAHKILWFDHQFGFSLCVYDPNGGGLFVKEKLNTDTFIHEGKEYKCEPLVSVGDFSEENSRRVLCSFSRGDYAVNETLGKMASDSVLVNRMHKEFKGAIENQNVFLCPTWDGWDKDDKAWDIDALKDFLNRKRDELDFSEHTQAEMDLAVLQLMKIDPERDRDSGMLKVDSFNMYKFRSKEKKDSAYGLCYSHFGVMIYKKMVEEGIDVSARSNESKFMVSSEEI